MNRSRIKQSATAIAICASVAAVVGIATGAAAPLKSGSGSNQAVPFAAPIGPPPGGPLDGVIVGRSAGAKLHAARPFGGPPVHSEMVVPNKAGDGFETITQDSGTVKSVSGNQVTIDEGTEKATYKTVTLDIPSDAKVLRNGKDASVSDLQQGDEVHVSVAPEGSFVFAADSAYQQSLLKRLRHLPRPAGVPKGAPPPGILPVPMTGRGN